MEAADPKPAPSPSLNAVLVLEDGEAFFGRGIGHQGLTTGEICFNTAMTGYQEIMSDPSYAGQIITFTFPHIGNVGANEEDIESVVPFAKGLVVREEITEPSNYRAAQHFNAWLSAHNMVGISGVDTRKLTRHIREHGFKRAAIYHSDFFGEVDVADLQYRAKTTPSLKGQDLAKNASAPEIYQWSQTGWAHGRGYGEQENPKHHVVAIDYGIKLNILRSLTSRGCRVTVVPATTKAEEILALNPDGVLLSNGPGDPAATGDYAVPEIKKLLAKKTLPMFGICLGHQMLCLALGGKTQKMHQGHRGANHPIKHVENGKVEITSQNHGFVVNHASLPENVIMSHFSLFDQTLAGIRMKDQPVFSVQYHPEASPGPHDSAYLFDQFIGYMNA